MLVYKGTDKDMKCQGFQYELGKEYEEQEAKLCEKGFHGCEYPLDVFGYYSPEGNRFFVANLDGVTDEKEDDSKRAGTKIKLLAEIGSSGLAKAAVEHIKKRAEESDDETGNWSVATNECNYSAVTNGDHYSAATSRGHHSAAISTGCRSTATSIGAYSAATTTGDCSAATNNGYGSTATNTNDFSVSANTGDDSAATSTGCFSTATTTGTSSAAVNTGSRSAAASAGSYSVSASTGDRSVATSTGSSSVAINTGHHSEATAAGPDSIAVVTGNCGKASGSTGCWLVLTERGGWNGNAYPIKEVRAVKVDGAAIKPGVFYKLENGEVVKA